MAVKGITTQQAAEQQHGNVTVISWAAMAGGDETAPISLASASDRSVQLTGTVTAVAIQGSNDGTNYASLHDQNGNSLAALAAAGIWQIQEITLWIKIVTTTGTAVLATLVASSPT